MIENYEGLTGVGRDTGKGLLVTFRERKRGGILGWEE